MKILVVDDVQTVGGIITRMLAELGHECEHVVDEAGARAAINGAPERFDRVILDLDLDGSDSSGLFEWIRAQAPGLARRVIVCTGEPAAAGTVPFVREHRLPVLAKPFGFEDIGAAIDDPE